MAKIPHEQLFREFASRYLGRPHRREDGIDAEEITTAEQRLGIKLPTAIRDYHLCLGAVDAFNAIHNKVFTPDELYVEGDYLMFMDENQSVVSWGLKVADLGEDDPEAWQLNNTPPEEWFSEEKTFTELMTSMFDWYSEMGVWETDE